MSTQTALWEGNEVVAHERKHAQSNSGDLGPHRVQKELGFFLTEKQKTFVHNLSEKICRILRVPRTRFSRFGVYSLENLGLIFALITMN